MRKRPRLNDDHEVPDSDNDTADVSSSSSNGEQQQPQQEQPPPQQQQLPAALMTVFKIGQSMNVEGGINTFLPTVALPGVEVYVAPELTAGSVLTQFIPNRPADRVNAAGSTSGTGAGNGSGAGTENEDITDTEPGDGTADNNGSSSGGQ